jgi:hypothetical protein
MMYKQSAIGGNHNGSSMNCNARRDVLPACLAWAYMPGPVESTCEFGVFKACTRAYLRFQVPSFCLQSLEHLCLHHVPLLLLHGH